MHVSRFVSLVSKPLLSSFCPRVAPVLCRTITTGQDHVRCGKGEGKRKDISRKLNVYVGTWITDHERAVAKYAHYMTEEEKNPIDPEGRLYRTFDRLNDHWIMVDGIVGKRRQKVIHFRPNDGFIFNEKGHQPCRGMVFQDVKGMIWVFVPFNNPEQVHSTHMMVRKNKLFVHKVRADGTVGFQVYYKH